MKKLTLALVCTLVIAMVTFVSCGKGGDGGGGGTTEQNLSVETNPAADGTTKTPSPEPFPLKVTIKSTMPPSGVKIEIAAKQEGASTGFYTVSQNSTTADNNFTITGTPLAVTCIVDITVTSISKPGNKWTGSYRYARK